MPSLKRNYLYNVSYQLLSIILPFATVPYISRILGTDGVGIFSYSLSIVAYFNILGALGTQMYGQKEIAFYSGDISNRSKIFFEVFYLRVISCASSIILYLIFCVNVYPFSIYFVQVIAIVSTIFDISWFFMGLEQFKKTVTRNLFVKIISLISIFIFVRSRDDVIIYALIVLISTLIGNLSLWPQLKGLIIRGNRINPFRDIKTVLLMFVPTVAFSMYTIMNKTMIGIFTADISQNGYFEQADKIVRFAQTILTSIVIVGMPRIAKYHAIQDKDSIKELLLKNYRYLWLIQLPMGLFMLTLVNQFTPWFFGFGWDGVIPVVSVFCLNFVFFGLNYITGVLYLIPTGKQSLYNYSILIAALVNIMLGIVLIPEYKAIGAAISQVTAEIFASSFQLLAIRKLISIKEILSFAPKYLFSSLVAALVLFITRGFINSTPVGTVILLSLGGTFYLLMLMILKDTLTIDMISFCIKRVKKKI